MSVNAAGSAQNVQQAVAVLRQTVQAEQVAAAALTEAATQSTPESTGPKVPGIGESLDIKA